MRLLQDALEDSERTKIQYAKETLLEAIETLQTTDGYSTIRVNVDSY